MPINFGNVDVSSDGDGFSPLEEGRYTVLVEEAKVGMSQKQIEKLSVTFVVLDNDKYKGRKLWHDFSSSEKALKFLKLFLIAVNSKYKDQSGELEDVAADVKNKKCTVWVEPGTTINDNPKNDLSKFKPLGDDPLAGTVPVDKPAGNKTLFK